MAHPRARFGGIDIVTKVFMQSVAFYRELGVDIPDEKIFSTDDGPQHVDLKLVDDGKFGVGFDIDSEALTAGYSPKWNENAAYMLSFRLDTSDDVDALHDHMVGLGYESHLAPWDAFWGARFAIIVDPDGNHVSLMGPMAEQ